MFLFRPRRIPDAIEIALLSFNSFMQCSLQFDNPSSLAPALSEVIRCVNAFRLRLGWIHLIATDSVPTVHKIPSSCHTLSDVNQWMFTKHTISPRQAFGTIAADDTRLVINISHAVGDSRYLVRLCEHLCDPDSYGKTNVPKLPESCLSFHRKGIKKASPLPLCSTNRTLTRLFPKLPIGGRDTYRFLTNYIYEPITSFKCYDRQTARVHGLTEAMWMALALSTAARNGGLAGGFGLSTVLDLRRFLTPEQLTTGGKQNWVSTMPVNGSAAAGQTVGEVAGQMRHLLTERIQSGEWLGMMRAAHNIVFRHPWRIEPPVPGLGIELSSVGPIRVRSPVADCHISMICPDNQPYRGISLLNYSVQHVDTGETTWVGLYQHNTMEMNEREGRLMAESVRYAMKNIAFEKTVGKAIEEIRRFQEGQECGRRNAGC
jgi:hypothetical protein